MRLNGSFSKHLERKSFRSSEIFSGIGIGSCTILIMAEQGCKVKYGGFVVRSSITVQPRLQISQAEVSWPFISMTSGAIQYGVPTTELLFSESVSLVATPKSASLTIPSLVVRILPPFMSL